MRRKILLAAGDLYLQNLPGRRTWVSEIFVRRCISESFLTIGTLTALVVICPFLIFCIHASRNLLAAQFPYKIA